jgi:diguanylate cyclase (GGDEF)-like protein
MGMRTSNGVGAVVSGVLNRAQGRPKYDAEVEDDFAASAALRLDLVATELRFSAALRELERMRRLEALYEEKVALLEEASAKAQRLAYRDELTDLPNRHLLLDRFNQAVKLADRHDKNVALLFLDLDGFKEINSKLGHSAGDELLRQIALRLVDGIRLSDTACRYGGDEFVVLLSEIGGKEGAFVVANSLRVNLAAPYLIDGASITITASVGIAIYPDDASGYGDLIQTADVAMYRHKARCAPAPIVVQPDIAEHGHNGGVVSLVGRTDAPRR